MPFVCLHANFFPNMNERFIWFIIMVLQKLNVVLLIFQRIAVTIGARNMCSDVKSSPSTKEKLKKALTEYGSTVMVFHVTISLMSLGGCYLIISSGIDLIPILEYLNIGEGTIKKIASSNASTFVIAYAVHKVFAPARMAITLTATPFIVRYLRKIGFIKLKVNNGGGK